MGRNPMVDGDFRNTRPHSPWRYVLIGLAVVAPIVGFIANEVRLQSRIDRADDLVVTWKNKLRADKDDSGSWKQWPGETLPDNDPWGNPLRVRYERDKHIVKLTVSSDGPDRKQWSSDDIKASESDMDWVGVARDSVEEVAGAASRGVVGGAIDGVTDRIRKARRDPKDKEQK